MVKLSNSAKDYFKDKAINNLTGDSYGIFDMDRKNLFRKGSISILLAAIYTNEDIRVYFLDNDNQVIDYHYSIETKIRLIEDTRTRFAIVADGKINHIISLDRKGKDRILAFHEKMIKKFFNRIFDNAFATIE